MYSSDRNDTSAVLVRAGNVQYRYRTDQPDPLLIVYKANPFSMNLAICSLLVFSIGQ